MGELLEDIEALLAAGLAAPVTAVSSEAIATTLAAVTGVSEAIETTLATPGGPTSLSGGKGPFAGRGGGAAGS